MEYRNIISVDDYNALRKAVGWKVLDGKQAARGLAASAFLVAVYDGEKAVGAARIIGDGGYMYLIADVMVEPGYQGRGIGRGMLERLSAWLDGLGKDGSCVMVNLMATKGNEGFYKKFGFNARPDDDNGAGMVRWING